VAPPGQLCLVALVRRRSHAALAPDDMALPQVDGGTMWCRSASSRRSRARTDRWRRRPGREHGHFKITAGTLERWCDRRAAPADPLPTTSWPTATTLSRATRSCSPGRPMGARGFRYSGPVGALCPSSSPCTPAALLSAWPVGQSAGTAGFCIASLAVQEIRRRSTGWTRRGPLLANADLTDEILDIGRVEARWRGARMAVRKSGAPPGSPLARSPCSIPP
jgi:hypothetical protein